jgi:hypothetical protein
MQYHQQVNDEEVTSVSVDNRVGKRPVVVVFFNCNGHLLALSCSVIRTSTLSYLSSWPKRKKNGSKKKKTKKEQKIVTGSPSVMAALSL